MRVSVRDARERLGRLLDAVEHGEDVEITRRGHVVAKLVPPSQPQATHRSFPSRAGLRAKLPPASEPAAETVRSLRDERG